MAAPRGPGGGAVLQASPLVGAMRAWCAALAVVLVLSGCAGRSGPSSGPAGATPTAVPTGPALHLPATNVTGVAAAAGWSQVAVSADGQAGDWLVVYQPLPEPVQSLAVHVTVHATASAPSPGAPANLFVWAPALVSGENGSVFLENAPFEPHVFFHTDSGPATFATDRSYGTASGASFHGVLLAVAADQPWSFSATFGVLDEKGLPTNGTTVAPSTLLSGNGAAFAYGGTRTAGLPQAPAGDVQLDAPVNGTGWTHIDLFRAALEPDAVRDYDVKLANGHAMSGLATSDGYYVPMAGGSSGSGAPDGVGSLRDVAGTAHAKVTYAETDLGVSFGIVHLPYDTARLPADLGNGNYYAFQWPFPDDQPPGAAASGCGGACQGPAPGTLTGSRQPASLK